MSAIARTQHTATISEIPFAIAGILARNAARDARRRRSWCRRIAKRVHRARIGRETIESNLPL